jgi:hypothetical protein
MGLLKYDYCSQYQQLLSIMIIRDNLRLPKPALMAIASIGWLILIYLVWVILGDSIERSKFAIGAITGQIPAEINPFIDRYTAHPWQTLAHTGSGMIFSVLGPMQFMSPIRDNFRVIHRISGRIFLPFGILSGIAALIMGLSFPVWGMGWNQIITTVAAAFMVFAFIKAFTHIRKREIPAHRRWMMRGFAIGMGVALFRVFLDDVLQPMGLSFDDSWNIVLATCFPVSLGAAEFWIWATGPKKA